jgi:hypothetical protein
MSGGFTTLLDAGLTLVAAKWLQVPFFVVGMHSALYVHLSELRYALFPSQEIPVISTYA